MAFQPISRGFFNRSREDAMHADDEKILKIAKEVLIKFIELGRVSPSNFDEHFRSVFWTVKNTVVSSQFSDIEISPPSEEKPEQD